MHTAAQSSPAICARSASAALEINAPSVLLAALDELHGASQDFPLLIFLSTDQVTGLSHLYLRNRFGMISFLPSNRFLAVSLVRRLTGLAMTLLP